MSFVDFPSSAGLSVRAARMARWGDDGTLGLQVQLSKGIALFATGQLLAQDGNTDKAVTAGLRGRL